MRLMRNAAWRCSLFLALTLLPGVTLSEDGIFIPQLDVGISESSAMAAVHRALNRRKWTVVERSDSHISGTIEHRGVAATLTILVEGRSLIYTCKGTRDVVTRQPAGGRMKTSKTKELSDFCPAKWVQNVKSDALKYMFKALARQAAKENP